MTGREMLAAARSENDAQARELAKIEAEIATMRVEIRRFKAENAVRDRP